MNESIPLKKARIYGPTIKQVQAAHTIIKQYSDVVKRAEGKTRVQCIPQIATGKGCLKWFPINELEYIQTMLFGLQHTN